MLPAFVTDEVHDSHIAEELARAFGVKNPGDIIELTIQELVGDGIIRRFRLPVAVYFASKNRGPEYIQIGLLDLDAYFEVKLVQNAQRPSDRWMALSLKPDSDRDCSEEPEE